ncbi:MAG: DUF5763 domain-containing protein [Kiritimatiellae bacterium]|nr:DUF5763 domain-containing protein [Kiritimatiellia bacterium]
MDTCQEIQADGTPCKMRPQLNGVCFNHDPARATERTLSRQRGGLLRSRQTALLLLEDVGMSPAEFKSPADVCKLLSNTIKNVQTGRLDRRIGSAVGMLAGVLLRAIEISTLDDRLGAIERELSKQKGA